MYKHILIATDGSELASKGVDQGLNLAKRLGAEVSVLLVIQPLQAEAAKAAISGGVRDPVGLYDQQVGQYMKDQYAAVERCAAKYGVAINFMHETDEVPAEAIVRVAQLKGCDLIVMASRGHRGLKKMILGSQTSEVLVTTDVPVLVIR